MKSQLKEQQLQKDGYPYSYRHSRRGGITRMQKWKPSSKGWGHKAVHAEAETTEEAVDL